MTRDRSDPLAPRQKQAGLTADKGASTFASFFDVDGFGMALAANEFDQQEMTEILIDHMRSTDPKRSLAAVKTFWGITKDIAALSGQVHQMTMETHDDGTVRRSTARAFIGNAPVANPQSTRGYQALTPHTHKEEATLQEDLQTPDDDPADEPVDDGGDAADPAEPLPEMGEGGGPGHAHPGDALDDGHPGLPGPQ